MPLSIVYVDDEPGLCEMFVDNFASSDVLIRTFVDSEEALLSISKNPPDLVFLDYRLPNTTGEEVAQKINGAIPIVLISGDLNVPPNNLFLKIFTKPFDFIEMEAFLQSFLGEKKSNIF